MPLACAGLLEPDLLNFSFLPHQLHFRQSIKVLREDTTLGLSVLQLCKICAAAMGQDVFKVDINEISTYLSANVAVIKIVLSACQLANLLRRAQYCTNGQMEDENRTLDRLSKGLYNL